MTPEIANQLYAVRKEIKEIEERHEAELAPKKALLESLQTVLITAFEKDGLKSLKTTEANFALTSRHGFTFTDEIRARAWAIENNAYSIDKRLAAQVLKEVTEYPDFIQPTETKYLTIKDVK